MNKAPKIRLLRLRGRNQITLPASVIDALSLEEGDYLAAVLDAEGVIRLRPAEMVTAGTREADRAMARAEADIAAGRSVEFDSVKDFTKEMLAGHDEQLADEQTAEARPSQTTMLVHVGAASTSASVQHHGVPIFTRSIEIGSANASTDQIAEEVRKTVEFFRSAVEGPGVGTLFLSAGPPPMRGLAQELESVVKLPVKELSAAAGTASSKGYEAAYSRPSFNIEDLRFNVAGLTTPKKLSR